MPTMDKIVVKLFLLISSSMAQSYIHASWKKVPDLISSKHPPESVLRRVYHVVGVIQCGAVCGQDERCDSYRYSFSTKMCSGFHGGISADGVAGRGAVSYVRRGFEFSTGTTPASPKDEGFLQRKTRTGLTISFKYITRRTTWQDARDQCHANGTELIILDSEEKQELIAQYVDPFRQPGRNRYSAPWVGMIKDVSGDKPVYKWINNSTTYIGWGNGEPDPRDNQECGQLDRDGMCDMQCHKIRCFICEKLST